MIFNREVVPVLEGAKHWEADHEEKQKALKKLQIDIAKIKEDVLIKDKDDPINKFKLQFCKTGSYLKPDDMKKFNAPAPNAYNPDKSDTILDTSAAYSFGLRPEEKIKSRAPAPNAYDPEKADTILDKQLKYTFGLKTKLLITYIDSLYWRIKFVN